MLDVKEILEDPKGVADRLALRGQDYAGAVHRVVELKGESNRLKREIELNNQLKKIDSALYKLLQPYEKMLEEVQREIEEERRSQPGVRNG